MLRQIRSVPTITIIIQVRTVKNSGIETNATFTNDELRDEVLRWKEKYDNASQELGKVEKELEKQRKKATENDSNSQQIEQEINVGNAITGLSDVNGEGVEITLKDNQNVTEETATQDISLYVVHDIDILSVVNELKNAGAEAIYINEQRLITTSAIECDGNIIKVNGEKIGAPFTIKAIGLPELLINVNRTGGYLYYLREERYLKVTVEKMADKKTVTIPKYTGIIKFQFAKSK